jgi:hypothetical protein
MGLAIQNEKKQNQITAGSGYFKNPHKVKQPANNW